MKKMLFIALLLLMGGSLLMTYTDTMPSQTALKHDAVILAFGDSLTYGYGVTSDSSYPSILAAKTGWHLINAGISGEESHQGLERLPKLLEANPDLVILCHGANDILRKRSLKALKKNLLTMIDLIKSNGAQVLLVGVPDFGWLGYQTVPLYREIAEREKVMFQADILSIIEADPSLKSDRIHPNEKGYRLMANAFIEVLQTNGVMN